MEEAYEVAGSVHANDTANFREELGDLLLHVVMHAEIAREAGRFDINDIINEIAEKLIRRHPHVFGKTDLADSGAVLRQWESIKRDEKKAIHAHYLDGISKALPALMRAQKVQSKAARVHFDWADPRDVIAKVDEELAEAKAAITSQDRPSIDNEIGDLLFAVVNLARKCSLDAESTLQSATDKFIARFNRLEKELQAQGKQLGEVGLDELDAIWNQVKKNDECLMTKE
jgi:tetrapyrrole methylase family protein / MazG family protein